MEKVKLPDGSLFRFWEPTWEFSKTYYVSANHPHAADDNPGTEDRPFRTIQRAAEALQPGERVIIGEGVYREWVRPLRGGTGPDKMISYEAAPGATVVIKGSEVIDKSWWRPSKQKPTGPLTEWLKAKPDPHIPLWLVRLPRRLFDGYNPFAVINRSQMAAEVPRRADQTSRAAFTPDELAKTLLKRGLVFQNGRRLKQVAHTVYMCLEEGTYWVDSNGLELHVRPYGDIKPWEAEFEVTTREYLFAPEEFGLGYIRVKGLTLEHAGNGWPLPPYGALMTFGGHHWVIEDNTVRQVNAVGIEVGAHTEDIRYSEVEDEGKHIVRRNMATDCGISGIAGTRLDACLVEENTVSDCAWHRIERNFENAGIKFHHTLSCLVRRNVVYDIRNGSGIWLDAGILNTRCCENLIYDVESVFGGIFVEYSRDLANLVDHNLLFDIEGNGIYEHDCDRLIVVHNLLVNCSGAAIMLRRGRPERMAGPTSRGSTGRKHRVFHNLLTGCGRNIEFHNADQESERNAFGPNLQPGPFRLHATEEYLNLAAWREFYGFDMESAEVEVKASLDRATLDLQLQVTRSLPLCKRLDGMETDFLGQTRDESLNAPGPFASLPKEGLAVSVDPRRKRVNG